jgi:hypothetical protein
VLGAIIDLILYNIYGIYIYFLNALIPSVSYYTKIYAKYPIRAAGVFYYFMGKTPPSAYYKKDHRNC